MSDTYQRSKHAQSAEAFRSVYKGSTNLMTPRLCHPNAYRMFTAKDGTNLYAEFSTGDGIGGGAIFGLTVVRRLADGSTVRTDLGGCFGSEEDARAAWEKIRGEQA